MRPETSASTRSFVDCRFRLKAERMSHTLSPLQSPCRVMLVHPIALYTKAYRESSMSPALMSFVRYRARPERLKALEITIRLFDEILHKSINCARKDIST
jgi:hypothetical protein